jgi:hypothetical protein
MQGDGRQGAEHIARGEGTVEAEDYGAGSFAFFAFDAEGSRFPRLSLSHRTFPVSPLAMRLHCLVDLKASRILLVS